MAEVKTAEKMKMRRFENAVKLVERARVIRRKVSAASGQWDAVKVLRDIRHAK